MVLQLLQNAGKDGARREIDFDKEMEGREETVIIRKF